MRKCSLKFWLNDNYEVLWHDDINLYHIPVKTDLISKQTELIDELKNQTMQLEALSGKARADSLVLHSEVTYLREHNDTAKGKLSVKYIRLISRGTLLSLTQ